MATEVQQLHAVCQEQPDDVLIVAASWEDRCLGILDRLQSYRARSVLFVAYDSYNPKREDNIKKMLPVLSTVGDLRFMRAKQGNPLKNVREIVQHLRQLCPSGAVRISLDATSFTKKHLLQILNALDLEGLATNINFYHTEPADFPTHNNQPISHGISSVRAIETFSGMNLPSRDTILIIFLGFEGARALALWQHLEPNITFAVIPDPPYRPNWAGRTEKQNQYLLSCLTENRILRCHSLEAQSADQLLTQLTSASEMSLQKYNYMIAPLGTKAQTVGLFRFWRRNRGLFTMMYASPVAYNHDQPSFPAERMWLIEQSANWF